MNNVKIIKASGDKQTFSDAKLRRSLKRSGAGHETISNVVQEITSQLKEEMKTIYGRMQIFTIARPFIAM